VSAEGGIGPAIPVIDVALVQPVTTAIPARKKRRIRGATSVTLRPLIPAARWSSEKEPALTAFRNQRRLPESASPSS
jgi:hypothetical protein